MALGAAFINALRLVLEQFIQALFDIVTIYGLTIQALLK